MSSGLSADVSTVGTASGSQRLLVVDDDDAVREVTVEMLTVMGYSADCVDSGQRALQCLAEERFDLLLLDVAMPTMSGAEVLAALDDLGITIPVILMTGFSASEVADLLERSGPARTLLSKPFPMKELRAAVESVFAPASALPTS